MSKPKNQEIHFEDAFKRLEEILEKMNSSELSLDKSLAYYEEADSLIQQCQSLLKNAEKKVEVLVKNRNKELQLDEKMEPLTQSFETEN